MSTPPTLTPGKRHPLIAAAIAITAAATFGAAWLTGDGNRAELTSGPLNISAANHGENTGLGAPNSVREVWRVSNTLDTLNLDDGGLTAVDTDGTLRVHDIATGTPGWEYRPANPICGVANTWENTVIVTRGPKGCGDVISLRTHDGSYYNTRSALASDNVIVQWSNDNAGTVSNTRVETWRQDMVRTVEIGAVEAPAQPDKQPNAECTMNSALWRKELIATVQQCSTQPADSAEPAAASSTTAPAITKVRLGDVVPDESTEPEDHASWDSGADAQVVAISQEAALLYVPQPDGTARFEAVNKAGGAATGYAASVSPAVEAWRASDRSTAFRPSTGDLPHHMTWFDGERLVAFSPSDLQPQWTVEDAIGSGAAYDDRALIPVTDGIAVVNWSTGAIERVIPVDREGYQGTVTLRVAGTFIVEQRGTTTVALQGS